MQKSLFAILTAMLIGVGMIGYANAETTDDALTKLAGDSIMATLTVAGTGMVSGAGLSLFRVIGKNIQTVKGDPFDFSKFLLTVIVGGVVGAVLGYIGVNQESAIGFDFIVVFFLSQTVFPIIKNRKWKSK